MERSKVGVMADGVIFLDSPKAKVGTGNASEAADGDQPDWPARRYRKKTA